MTTTPTTEKRISETYEVLSSNWTYAKKKLDQLVRKAEKIGVDALTYKALGLEQRQREEGRTWDGKPKIIQYEVVLVQLTGIAPAIAGWTFAATIQHTPAGNLIRKTPGLGEDVEAPVEFRTAPQGCDHCKAIRKRHDTFLLVNEQGEWKQVGRNCLGDFLGGRDPHGLLESLELFDRAIRLLSDGNEDGFGGGSGSAYTYNVESFLSSAALFIRIDGWLGRKQAREQNRESQATADQTLWLLSPSFTSRTREEKNKIEAQATEQDSITGKEALEWVRTVLAGKDVGKRSEYEHNLVVALSTDWITWKEAGLVASAVFAHLRNKEREVARRKANEARLNEWFGAVEEERVITQGKNKGQTKKVKPRYELTLTVEKVFSTESQWGATHITKLSDGEGRSFTWFASRMLNAGDVVKATWSVKKHDEYQGFKQTVIFRPTGMEINGQPAA